MPVPFVFATLCLCDCLQLCLIVSSRASCSPSPCHLEYFSLCVPVLCASFVHVSCIILHLMFCLVCPVFRLGFVWNCCIYLGFPQFRLYCAVGLYFHDFLSLVSAFGSNSWTAFWTRDTVGPNEGLRKWHKKRPTWIFWIFLYTTIKNTRDRCV